ncbi:MAG: putative Anaphase-promoting complex subunit 8 [Streblomastix strix]|uniref:Putative Anaphase-promoting complex subunit 8 n=1 Tax=Streblomastix strix TaxID=222440 RepID=A0A5J4X8M5_9EUKA|nr:MAG: putative Anaphase-promoting complex subunit 8 [Streblomastix strix]
MDIDVFFLLDIMVLEQILGEQNLVRDFDQIENVQVKEIQQSSSLALAGLQEKKSNFSQFDAGSLFFRSECLNPRLNELDEMFSSIDESKMDGFLFYLKGLILKEKGLREESLQSFATSIKQCPFIWEAWQQICKLCTSLEELKLLDLPLQYPAGIMTLSRVAIKFHIPELALQCAKECIFFLPNSPQAIVCMGEALYEIGNYTKCREWLEGRLIGNMGKLSQSIQGGQPFAFAEGRDTLSNVLYIEGDLGALCELANDTISTISNAEIHSETHYIVGNYLSLKGDSIGAIDAFQRALDVDEECGSAWTLMGHEYLQVRNTPGASYCYRRAIALNQNDYRAWFGLGQASELLGMYRQAVVHYARTCKLRPSDSRMWISLGSCYEKLKKVDEAAICFTRADEILTAESQNLCQQKLTMYANDLLDCMNKQPNTQSEAQSFLFLAAYLFHKGNVQESDQLCKALSNWDGIEKSRASALRRVMGVDQQADEK